jgi:hypothetical protein
MAKSVRSRAVMYNPRWVMVTCPFQRCTAGVACIMGGVGGGGIGIHVAAVLLLLLLLSPPLPLVVENPTVLIFLEID